MLLFSISRARKSRTEDILPTFLSPFWDFFLALRSGLARSEVYANREELGGSIDDACPQRAKKSMMGLTETPAFSEQSLVER